MALSTTTNTISYTGNGATTVFALPYLTFSTAHVFVSLDGVPQVSGFTVSTLPPEGGNPNVTFSVAPANGVVVLLQRIVPETQTSVYTVAGPFPAKATEKNLDLLMMAVQQKTTQITNITAVTDTLPDVTNPANFGKGVKVKEDGTGYSTFVIGSGGGSSVVDTWDLGNARMRATVTGPGLTIALKTNGDLDPSPGDSIPVRFFNPNSGASELHEIDAPFSVLIPPTATLGLPSGVTGRVYFGVGVSFGTLYPWVYQPMLNGNHRACSPSLQNEIGELASFPNDAQRFLGPTLTSFVNTRIIGFVDCVLNGSQSVSSVILANADTPASGTLLMHYASRTPLVSSGTTQIPVDGTIPQISEGTSLATVQIFKRWFSNPLFVNASGMLSASGATTVTLAVFFNSNANAVAAGGFNISGANVLADGSVQALIEDVSANVWDVEVRYGPSSAVTAYVNRTGPLSSGVYGGVISSPNITITELMV
jgi:hypothetical protein